MSIEESVLENLRELSPDAQREVLKLTEDLRRQSASDKKSLKSLYGLWADMNIQLTDADIAQARREMWGKFPREINP